MNEQLRVPQLSVAVHVTVVVPTGNVEPEARLHVTVVPLPVGVVKFTTAPSAEVAEVVIFAGQVIAGVPFTVTEKLHDDWPPALVAVQLTIVVPSGKLEPEAGVQFTVTPGTDGIG